ncbi:MAG: PAS domain S-box protein, partial [Janthinobacterium lividum]
MHDHDSMVRRQKVLGDFGEFALDSDDLNEVLTEACRLVGDVLGTGRAKVVEIEQDGTSLFVRAGVGWEPDVVGKLHLPMDEYSSETFAIRQGKPVIMEDLGREKRFDIPDFMKQAGVVAMANVPIFLPGRRPYGLLQVDSTEPRDFGHEDTEFLRTYTMILGPVIDRLLNLRAMSGVEERFRLIVGSTSDYAIFLTDAEDHITDWLPGAEAVYGFTVAEAKGQSASMLFTPEDRARNEPQREVETARREGAAPNVRWHVRKDGGRVFIDGAVSALYEADGAVRGFLKIGQDVTARRQREEDLRRSEERFRGFADASSDVLWIRDADSLQFEYLSPAFDAVYGRSVDSVLSGDTLARWTETIHAEDRSTALSTMQSLRAGERIRHEFRIVRPSDGEVRWIQNTDFPLLDEAGRVQRVAGIAKDVTEEKASAARLEVLVAELQHRSRNLLGVITAIASRTLMRGGSVKSFETRLQALSRAQGLLSQFGSDTVEVGALVRLELAAHTDISGPK